MVFIVTALRRIGRGTVVKVDHAIYIILWMGWDLALVFINLITFKRKVGRVTPKGQPGEGGVWPEYIPPREGDSRAPCPGLNAMANHGIIPRDGRNLAFRDLPAQIRATYNFSPSFCDYVLRFAASMLNRPFKTGRFDLSDLDVHNGIEHDASLLRRDQFEQFHQNLPDGPLIAALLRSATGPPPSIKQQQQQHTTSTPSQDPLPPSESPYFEVAAHVAKATSDIDLNRTFTASDMARRIGERRRESQRSNPKYTQTHAQKVFGSTNGAILLRIFGGRLNDIYTFVTEERLPNGWESRVRDQMGLTTISLNRSTFRVELDIKEEVDQPLIL